MDRQTAAAAKDLQEEEVVGEDGEGQRRQRQVQACETEGGQGDDGAHDTRRARGGEDADGRGAVGDLGRNDSTEADKRHLAQ